MGAWLPNSVLSLVLPASWSLLPLGSEVFGNPHLQAEGVAYE